MSWIAEHAEKLEAWVKALTGHAAPEIAAVREDIAKTAEEFKASAGQVVHDAEGDAGSVAHEAETAAEPVVADAEKDAETVAGEPTASA